MGYAKKHCQDGEKIQSKPTCSVKWFSLKKGYGFLELAEQGVSNIFIHFSLLESVGCQHVAQGDEIVCDIEQGERGFYVTKVYSVNSVTNQPQDIPLTLEETTGVVKWFNVLRGYGFIEADDGGRDIFFHTGSLKDLNVDRLLHGQRVSTKVLFTERGREAREIRFINDDDAQAEIQAIKEATLSSEASSSEASAEKLRFVR